MQFHYGTRNGIIKGLNLRCLDIGLGIKVLEKLPMNENCCFGVDLQLVLSYSVLLL